MEQPLMVGKLQRHLRGEWLYSGFLSDLSIYVKLNHICFVIVCIAHEKKKKREVSLVILISPANEKKSNEL